MEALPTIHVVDDNAAVRRSLRQLLHSVGLGCAVYETALGFPRNGVEFGGRVPTSGSPHAGDRRLELQSRSTVSVFVCRSS
jgi:hypothetical protein